MRASFLKIDLNIKDNTIYFTNTQEKINYEFVDQIGIFAERFRLIFDKDKEGIFLNLDTNFKNNIRSRLKIKLYIDSYNDINESFVNVNNFYLIKVYKEGQFLFIESIPKKNLFESKIINNTSIIKSLYVNNIFLEKIIDDSNMPSSIYKIDNDIIYIEKIIDIIKKSGINKQQWKLSIRFQDENNNELTTYIDLYDLAILNEKLLEKNDIYYNKSNNYLLFNRIKNDQTIKIKFAIEYESYIKIVLNKFTKHSYLFMAVRSRQGNIFNYNNYLYFKIEDDSVCITYDQLNSLSLIEDDNIDLLIGESLSNAVYITASKDLEKKDYFQINGNIAGKFYINGRKAISIYIKNSILPNNKVLKVAVLGTCFSRNALNTMDYFNPEYKKYVECVFTQFHSSLVSLNSYSAPQQLLQEYINHNEFNHIQVDMDKTFYENLYNSNADVLIIDLYSDALLNPIRLKNGSIITHNYLIKDNNSLGEFVENWNINKYLNENEILKNFEINLDIFMDRVTKVIPEKNIILNKGRLAENYKEDDEIKTFKTIKLIKRNNYFWELLDNIVLNKYPNIKVIDLTKKSFFASQSHPFGFSFSHYESEYYKTFFNELIKKLYLISVDK